ncbi:MAG: hypothetical protein PHO28_00420, partial [Candidatus Pacebacteria bacterium]|nr:hypothetical protein [Candidatus Paceibacterota bacterium]
TTAAEKIGVLNAAIKDGNLDDLIERFNVSQQEIRDLINQGRQWNIHGTIEKAAPHLIKEDITDENRENELIIRDRNSERVRNIVSRMKPADYGNIANAALEDIDVLDAMIDTATGNHIRELIEKKGLAAVNALEGRFQDMIDIRVDPGKYLQEHNPRLYKYLTAGPGVSLINLPSLPPPPPPSPPSPPQPDDEDLFNSPGWEYDSFFPKRTDEEEWTFSKSKSDQPSPQPDEESKDRQGEENRGTPLNPEGNPRGEPI